MRRLYAPQGGHNLPLRHVRSPARNGRREGSKRASARVVENEKRAALATRFLYHPEPMDRLVLWFDAYFLVITTSRYSLGTTIVPSLAMLKRAMRFTRSSCSVACAGGSRAANAFSTGP